MVDSECDRVCPDDCVWRILVYEDRNEGHSTFHGRGQGGFIESNRPQKTELKIVSELEECRVLEYIVVGV